MKLRIAISFYFLLAFIFILEGWSLNLAPMLDHQAVPRKLQVTLITMGLVFLTDAIFLIRRAHWALKVARFLAIIGLAPLLSLLFHLREVTLFSVLVFSLTLIFVWISTVFWRSNGIH